MEIVGFDPLSISSYGNPMTLGAGDRAAGTADHQSIRREDRS